tara:strand:- start:3895 stop:5007 length:1113 start_codon:yes stop_codon:yes gene_type:complete
MSNLVLNKKELFNEKGVNINYLLSLYYVKRFLIFRITLIFILVGFFIAIFTKNSYFSTTTLVPQSSGSTKLGGSLGGLAAMAGINLSGMSSSTEIAPILYPKIFESLAFQKELLNTELDIEAAQDKISFATYYKEYYDPGFLADIKKYTIGLPGVIISSFRSSKNLEGKPIKKLGDSLARVSEEERMTLAFLQQQVSIEINEKEGFIMINAEMPEPLAAAEMADRAKNLLQKTIIEFQIEKANFQLEYLEKRLQESKEEFEISQTKLANFTDRNLYSSTARSSTMLERLQTEYDLNYSVYSELAKQVETQRLQVKRDTPVFTIIQPPVVPYKKYKPNRVMILSGSVILGLLFSFLFIFGREYMRDFKENF